MLLKKIRKTGRIHHLSYKTENQSLPNLKKDKLPLFEHWSFRYYLGFSAEYIIIVIIIKLIILLSVYKFCVLMQHRIVICTGVDKKYESSRPATCTF
jgi:hypothetical protein